MLPAFYEVQRQRLCPAAASDPNLKSTFTCCGFDPMGVRATLKGAAR
jgi:hypothetical protein